MELQQQFIDAVTRALADDERVRAAWLEGSFGRGDADRYSDVDLHVLLIPGALDEFRAGAEAWLADLRPLVLYKEMFGGSMLNAMTRDGLRVDVWLHEGEDHAIDPARAQVLHARPGALVDAPPAAPPDPAQVAARLDEQIREFWRCIAMLPVVLGRGERIVGHMGLTVEQGILVNVLLDGYAIPRDAGVKKLNPFLPDDLRRAVEDALEMPGLTLPALARAHLALAHIMQAHGPVIAQRHGFDYAQEMEHRVLSYVHQEMARLGLDALP